MLTEDTLRYLPELCDERLERLRPYDVEDALLDLGELAHAIDAAIGELRQRLAFVHRESIAAAARASTGRWSRWTIR